MSLKKKKNLEFSVFHKKERESSKRLSWKNLTFGNVNVTQCNFGQQKDACWKVVGNILMSIIIIIKEK